MSSKAWLLTLLAAFALGGCSGTPPAVQSAPDLRPAIAAPVKPINAIPTHIAIPAIGVDAEVISIGLDNNQFELKPLDADPRKVGWYLYGPPPGSPGPATLLSHVNYNGVPGAFAHLDNVKVGNKVTISRGDGPDLVFTVTKVLTWSKAKFDQLHPFDPTPDAQLRLATCGGTYDKAHRNYLSNVWVYASLDKP